MHTTNERPDAHTKVQAIVQDAYGPDPEKVLRIGQVAMPMAGHREVVVKVAAASVDRGTWHLMTGQPQLMRLMGFGFRRPKGGNPGRAFAGTVVAVGEGVTQLAAGDEVYGTCGGSFAEYVAASVDKVARKPASLSFEEAAAVPISAVAALQAVRDRAYLAAGQRALVVGASGGVGTFLVQLAKTAGAEVTGVASSAKLPLVRALGADTTIDYTREDFADGRHTYDAIFDTGGNRPLSEVRWALAPGGTLVVVGGESTGRWLGGFARTLRAMLLAPFARRHRLRSLASKENAADLDELRSRFDAGQLFVAIDRAYPLADTAAAVRHLMDGSAQGKVVISM